jgi:hypothetical protein
MFTLVKRVTPVGKLFSAATLYFVLVLLAVGMDAPTGIRLNSTLNTKMMTLGRVVDGEKTPRWAARGIEPPRPWEAGLLRDPSPPMSEVESVYFVLFRVYIGAHFDSLLRNTGFGD